MDGDGETRIQREYEKSRAEVKVSILNSYDHKHMER